MKKNTKKVKLDLEILELEAKIAPISAEGDGTYTPGQLSSGAEC